MPELHTCKKTMSDPLCTEDESSSPGGARVATMNGSFKMVEIRAHYAIRQRGATKRRRRTMMFAFYGGGGGGGSSGGGAGGTSRCANAS